MAFSPFLRENLHPGPVDRSLLKLQNQHISSSIWFGQERLLRPKCKYDRGPKPHDSILKMLKIAGFGYVAQIEKFDIDISLISALVERWRPETCTFHLPHGECTVTLEDVALQLGVAIDGDPVTPVVTDWPSICRDLLGAVPPASAWSCNGQTVLLSWFTTRFSALPANATRVVVEQYTRAYIMRLIGGLLMPDKLGKWVDLMYLPLLRDLSRVARYSWGSAVLACLYRELCHATEIDAVDIGGCLVLLQAWAWDRIPHFAPQVDQLTSIPVRRELGFPLAQRWSSIKKTSSTPKGPNHTVKYYRYSLDQLEAHQFIWTPYASLDVRRCIPLDPGDVCYAMVPLICLAIVEWHHADRVMRQFGLRQSIPQPPTSIDRPHEVDMKGQGDMYWLEENKMWINLWMQRRERLVQGRPFHGYLDENSDYMRWYLHVTRRWISRDGAFIGTLVFGVHKILQYSASENPTTNLGNISQMCNHMLNVLQQCHPLFLSPVPNATPPTHKFPVPPPPLRPPLPMGFASYSHAPNAFSFSPLPHPMGPPSYPSSSHHVPHSAKFGSSPQYSSFPNPSTSQYPPKFPVPPSNMGTTPSMYTSGSGTTSSTLAGGAYPPPYRTTIPYTETEDEEESGEDFTESEIYSESDDVATLGAAASVGYKGRGK